MGGGGRWGVAPQPTATVVGPPDLERDEHWSSFDDSVNAVSFGFVATAILISMFLLMAIFEKFLRARSSAPPSSTRRRARTDVESQVAFRGKLDHSPTKTNIYAKELSVLMPGEELPTFIAQPAPPPCPPERIYWPHHQPDLRTGYLSNTVQNQTQ